MHWLRQNPAELRQLRQLRLFSDTSETTTAPTTEPGARSPVARGLTLGQGSTTVAAVITSLRSYPRYGPRANEGLPTVWQLWSKLLSRVLPQNGNGFV